MSMSNFAVFIPSFGRADNVKTYETLRRLNYTGKIYIVCSDDDKTLLEYQGCFGDACIVFNKDEYSDTFDIYDNFDDKRTVIFARNAIFDIAKNLGLDYFLVLDDDYNCISYRIIKNNSLIQRYNNNLDTAFDFFIEFMENTPHLDCLCMAQNGDFIGGVTAGIISYDNPKRKLMNSFFCSTKRPFKYSGRLNDDVNTYVVNQKTGSLYLTHPILSINQAATQQNSGGLTDIYLSLGTYVKSFYTVLANPSSVKIKMMGEAYKRLHHSVKWDNAVPKLISETWKK